MSIEKSEEEDQVLLKIPTAREKLLPNFPNDNRSDITIVYKSKKFFLSKPYLRLESGYFKRVFNQKVSEHYVTENFSIKNQQISEEDAFQKVLSCFYGATIKMQRSWLGIYYPIIKFLQIDSLLSFLRKDILQNIPLYDLFIVMKLAHNYSDQELFQACLEELEKQNFEQLKYHQFQLLQTDISLFKLIIKTHDRHRMDNKPGISYSQINQIIKDYCEGQGLGEQGYLALKYELISQNSLTSQEYKQIYLNQVIKMKIKPTGSFIGEFPTNQSITVNQSSSNSNTHKFKLEANKLAESVIATGNGSGKNIQNIISSNTSPNFSSYNPDRSQVSLTNELTLQMQNTYQKKQNDELRLQNKVLTESLQKFKQITTQNQKIHEEMQKQLKVLKEELKKKQITQKQNRKLVDKFEKTITEIQKQLAKKSSQIDKLTEQFEELKKRRPLPEEQEQNNLIVQSQFLPAHLIGDIMLDNKKSTQVVNKKPEDQRKQVQHHQPNYQAMDEEELEQLYLPRISFDIQPISTPKYNLPKLCNFITSEGFNKHTLNLIYRRSVNNPPKGNNSDLRQRSNLLVLITTGTGQNIGGYVSVRIPKNDIDYISDKGAFIFSLSKNQKFNIKPVEASEAIFMSDQYLLSFANDMMIASDCLKQKSECTWPSSYEGIKSLKEKGSVWFAGQSQFSIKHLEIYQMGEEQEMEMVI